MKAMKKFAALTLALVMVLGLMGCQTQKLDQQPTAAPALQETTAAPTEAPAETRETLGADDFFGLEDAEDQKLDSDKYEEKEITVHRGQNGTVFISDGSQQGQDIYMTDVVPEGQQLPVDELEIDTDVELTCYLTIDCSTILYNMESLQEGKDILVPADGLILPWTAVAFYEGESVFQILDRVTKDYRIHMSSRFTPLYNSAYIEAIGNLYEFDCGPNSGWMYNVNGWYPNYGVSRYVVQDGDEIQFNYTCDLGDDLGAGDVGQG